MIFNSWFRTFIGLVFSLLLVLSKESVAQCGAARNFGVLNAPSGCAGDGLSRTIIADDDGSTWNPATDVIGARINWDDGSPPQDVVLNFNSVLGFWILDVPHTYPDNGNTCFYEARARLSVNGTFCFQSLAFEEFNVLIYDELDNPNVGTHDITHDVTSAGALNPVTDEVDVCENETNPVRLIDNSEFNCTQANLDSPPQDGDFRNDEERWVQWVYGTNETITGDVEIDGVTVSTFPYFGPVTFIGDNTADPANDVTLGMVFPTAVAGEFFEVTLRSWNICNPYDDNTTDANYLNPTGGVFDPAVEATFGAFPNASEAPVTTTQIIRIITVPLPPTPVDPTVCENSNLAGVNFTITGTGGSTRVNWYDNDPNLGGNLVTNPNGNNSNNFPATSFPGGLTTNTPGTFSMWATYVLGGANDCESDPVEVVLTIREELARPDPFSTFTNSLCNGTNNVVFTLPNPPGSTTFGGPVEYIWTSTGGGGVNLDANTGNSITVDFNIPGSFVTVNRTIEVRRRYLNNPRCPSP